MNSAHRRFRTFRLLVLITMVSFEIAACAHLTFETEAQREQPWYCRWFAKPDGIHYYRPKPYLLVTESMAEKTGTPASPGQTTESCAVEIKYLPDYTQEYVIIPHYWIGSVALKPTLTDGWNLTNFDSTVDTKVPETITALAGAAQTAGKLAALSRPGQVAAESAQIQTLLEQGMLSPGMYAIVPSDTGGLALDTGAPVFQAKGTICDKLTAVAKPSPSPAAAPTK